MPVAGASNALRAYAGRLTPAERGRRVVLAVFVVSRLVIVFGGRSFSPVSIDSSYQLLDPKYLGAHPFRSVFYLHTQPPLFNLFVGLVFRWTPFDVAQTFHALYVLCGLVLALGLYGMLSELGAPPWMATVATCVAIVSPYVATNEQVVTYELPVATMLVLATWACARYVKSRALAPFVAFVGLVAAIVLTRSLFHWIWLVAVVGGVLLLARPKVSWRKVAVVVAVPVALVGGVILKNEVLFNSASLSSWDGMNLSRSAILPLKPGDLIELERKGVLSPQAVVPPLSPYYLYEPLHGPCKADNRDPVLTSSTKSTGATNYNATCFLPVYRQAERDARAAAVHRPIRFLRSRGVAGALYLSNKVVWHGPQDSTRTVDSSDSPVTNWLAAPYQLFYLPLTVRLPVGGWALQPFRDNRIDATMSLTLLAGLVAVVVQGVVALWRIVRRQRRPLDVTWAFIGGTFAFVAFISIVAELGEQDRFRSMIDPLLIGLVAWQLCRFGGWVVAKVRAAGTPSSGPPAPDEIDEVGSRAPVGEPGALSRPAGVR